MGDLTPPPLHGPTSKERKYDRQLRLWAANGQQALEDAHVLLINSGPGVAGIEALKNLVLPGIGKFTILDPALVTEADLGVNFFLEDEDLGAFRSERCCKWLKELNPDVKGYHISEPIETFLNDASALSPYTLILLALPAQSELVQRIAAHSTTSQIPVFYIHSIGFYGHFTLQLPEAFPIVDTHPDPATIADLRLLEPWPELSSFVEQKTKNMEVMDNQEHGHIPYVLILLHHLSLWRHSHDDNPPLNYSEKRAFRDQVTSSMRTNTPEGSEENFEEATNAVLKSLNPHAPSTAVEEIFSEPECTNLTKDSPTFWLIASAIRTFYQNHNKLPLSGGLPDMKAKSGDYIALQQLYKSKARSDAAEVKTTVASLDKQLKRPVPTPEAEIDAFCKSAGYIKLVRGHVPHFALADEGRQWSVGKDRAKAVAMQLSDPFLARESVFPAYAALIAYDSYAATHQLAAETEMASGSNMQQPSDPTFFDHDPEETIAKIMGIAKRFLDAVLNEAGQFIEDPGYTEIKERIEGAVKDLVHAKGGELHNIAAVIGGMVAQEAIKVVTKQYVPVDNVCLFDGVNTRVGTLRL